MYKNNLTLIREQKGITARELSKKSGVCYSSICYYERDGSHVSFDSIIKLANALNVSIDYLIGRSSKNSFDKEDNKEIELKRMNNYLGMVVDNAKHDYNKTLVLYKTLKRCEKEIYERNFEKESSNMDPQDESKLLGDFYKGM